MLNQMTAMRASVPQNQFIAVDPLVMRRSGYDSPVLNSARTTDKNYGAQKTERDPFTLASPFCNPNVADW